MKFRTHHDGLIDDQGTHLQGYIQASQAQLEHAFGTPEEVMSSRVTYYWTIAFADGTVATIYDWKGCPGSRDQSIGWHIGGTTRDAVQRVHDAFREAHDLNARAA